jgi:hypothetical protein
MQFFVNQLTEIELEVNIIEIYGHLKKLKPINGVLDSIELCSKQSED